MALHVGTTFQITIAFNLDAYLCVAPANDRRYLPPGHAMQKSQSKNHASLIVMDIVDECLDLLFLLIALKLKG